MKLVKAVEYKTAQLSDVNKIIDIKKIKEVRINVKDRNYSRVSTNQFNSSEFIFNMK